MAFGKNHAELVGRLGADVVVNHLASGDRTRGLRPDAPPGRAKNDRLHHRLGCGLE